MIFFKFSMGFQKQAKKGKRKALMIRMENIIQNIQNLDHNLHDKGSPENVAHQFIMFLLIKKEG